MARQILILARNITEANQYARAAGLQRFTYRAVRSAAAIRGVRNAEVHLLSSFTRRLDRHAILGALRWAKVDVYYVDFREGEIRDGTNDPSTYADDGFDLEAAVDANYGELTDRELEVAYRYNRLRDATRQQALDDFAQREMIGSTEEDRGEETGETEPSEDPAPVAPRRRRTRCSQCGNLHYKDEPCVEPDPAPVPDFTF